MAKKRRWKSPTGKVEPTAPTPSDARVSAREGSREAFTGETTGQVLSCETGLIPRCRSYLQKEGLRQVQALIAQGRRAPGRNHLRHNRRNPPSIYAHRMRHWLCPILKLSLIH